MPEKKGDLFTMSVFISRRQRGAQMHQHLIKRGTRTQRLVGLDRRRNRLLRVLQEFSKSDNRLSRRGHRANLLSQRNQVPLKPLKVRHKRKSLGHTAPVLA